MKLFSQFLEGRVKYFWAAEYQSRFGASYLTIRTTYFGG